MRQTQMPHEGRTLVNHWRGLLLGGLFCALGLALATLAAHAGAGQPTAGEMGLQDSVTPVMDDIRWFHNSWVNPIIVCIMLCTR